jgi:hypothetical protein
MDDDGRRRGARERLAWQSQTSSQTGLRHNPTWVSAWGQYGAESGLPPTTAFSASIHAASPTFNPVDTLLSFEMSATVLLPGDVLPQLPGLAKLGPGTLQTSSRATPSSSSSSSPLLVATRAGILGADPKGKRMWVEGRGKRVRPLFLLTLSLGALK